MSEQTAGLTRRELEILRLVAPGHSTSQVAKILWVTEQTIDLPEDDELAGDEPTRDAPSEAA